MKRTLPFFILLSGLLFSASWGRAQNTLIHYWHFNDSANQAAQYFLPSIVPVHADYSILDTAKAKMVYEPVAGTSAGYITYYDFNQGDTINARLGHENDSPGYSLRLRNPSDSMEARFYVPTTGYKDLKFSFETEASSAGNGAKTQYFDYSLDSGATWRTSGMSVLSTYFSLTYPARDSVAPSWGKVIVSFDSTVNDNSRFVVRMKFGPANTGSSGNDRIDNVALDGDSLNSNPPPPPPPDTVTLIHYWHFNNLDTAYHNPGIPAIFPDSSLLPHGQAKLIYALVQGTNSSYSGYVDNVSGTALNARYGSPAGQGLRVRNPSDSIVLFLYIATTGYKNIRLSYATETSSLTHGQLQQQFQYSTDGLSYKTAGLNITDDSVQANWSTVNINFGNDSAVNDNGSLIMMIKFAGNTSDSSGNNRFDNIVVEGDSLHPVSVRTIAAAAKKCTLYPNPAKDKIFISTPGDGTKTLIIYNLAGQKVYHTEGNGHLISLPVAGLRVGMYSVWIHDDQDNTDYSVRFVKQE